MLCDTENALWGLIVSHSIVLALQAHLLVLTYLTLFMKRFILILYTLIIALLALATWIEHTHDTAFVARNVYHTWWFCALWAVLALLLVAAIVKRKLWHRPGLMMLHASFIVILCGALTTFITSKKGYIHLLPNAPTAVFQTDDTPPVSVRLPFHVQLKRFYIKCYEGTDTPSDYVSQVSITRSDGSMSTHDVSMNNVLSVDGYRFYQSSYDEDEQGSWLSVNYDPWGTAVTYIGYLLLALSMLLTLISRKEEFRRLLRDPRLKRGGLIVLLLLGNIHMASAERSLPAFNREKADSLAQKQVVYNGRVAPFNTLARDFLLKIYGRPSYGGLTPEQVVSGWLLRPDAWQGEAMILIKNKELRSLLHIEGRYARLSDLFSPSGDYLLRQYWKGSNNNEMTTPNDPLQKAIAETDEKVGLIMMLQKGTLIQPLPQDGSVKPLSSMRVKAELLYNCLPLTEVLFMFNLTIGLLAFARLVWRNVQEKEAGKIDTIAFPAVLALSTLTLLFGYLLRWYIAGHVPMSNGFETMQFMALSTLIVSCLLYRRFLVMLPFGLLLSGFALLVSHLGESNPQVTNLMPVLVSPWLSLHVSVVMMGYSLLGFVMLTGIVGLCVKRQAESLMLLGRLLLYPGVFFLGIGIFLGAVWANQSWGSYWSWDPKEVWALITFMLYSVAFHSQSIKWMRYPRHFHLFSVMAFIAVLITYFGVNFLLGGMHSYAG